jgi:hypothetical protein
VGIILRVRELGSGRRIWWKKGKGGWLSLGVFFLGGGKGGGV